MANLKLGKAKRSMLNLCQLIPQAPFMLPMPEGRFSVMRLAHLLQFAGFDVTREYYINDAGTQVDVLARSAYLRYREAFGEEVTIPAGLYPGEYLKDVGEALKAEFADRFLDADEESYLAPIREFAFAMIMAGIKEDLSRLGVSMDLFSSERALTDNGKVQAAIDHLAAQDLIYHGVLEKPKGQAPEDWEEREQIFFKAKQFGDDTDSPFRNLMAHGLILPLILPII